MVTHIVGGGLGILVLIACVIKAAQSGNLLGVIGSAIYGGTMIILYAVSSVYHGLRPSTGKKVMQVIDHCTIYFLICGTYTPILLSVFVPASPVVGWGLLAAEWVLAITAGTLTAIDLKKYNVLYHHGLGDYFLPAPCGFTSDQAGLFTAPCRWNRLYIGCDSLRHRLQNPLVSFGVSHLRGAGQLIAGVSDLLLCAVRADGHPGWTKLPPPDPAPHRQAD